MTERHSRRDLISGAATALLAGAAIRPEEAVAAAANVQEGGAGLDVDLGWTGAVRRDVADRIRDTVSVLDFIPVAEHAAIRARTSTRDLAPYFRAAMEHVRSAGGGELFIPAGRYRCGSTVALPKYIYLRGASRTGTMIQFTHEGTGVPDGSGFALVQPSNRSIAAHVQVSDLTIEMINPRNKGACFYDNCSTYVTLRSCVFAYGLFGVVFDQTEVSGIYSCHIAGQYDGGAGLWLVNGPDITPGNLAGFTNQITVDHNCQFDVGQAHAVIDDGGEAHYFGNNNYNGGGLRFCGVANLTIMGGEYESVNARPTMTFHFRANYGNNGVGACHAVIINPMIVQPGGKPCIEIVSMYSLVLMRAMMTCTGVAGCVTGMGNLGAFFGRFNINPNTGVPVLDGYASGFHDDGGMTPIRSTASTAYTLTAGETGALLQSRSDSASTITVPSHAALPLQVGTRILIEQNGAGPVRLRAERGVDLHGTLATTGPFQLLSLIKTAPDRWLVTRQE